MECHKAAHAQEACGHAQHEYQYICIRLPVTWFHMHWKVVRRGLMCMHGIKVQLICCHTQRLCVALQGRSPSQAKHSDPASPAAEGQRHQSMPGLSTMYTARFSTEDKARDVQCELQAAITPAVERMLQVS